MYLNKCPCIKYPNINAYIILFNAMIIVHSSLLLLPIMCGDHIKTHLKCVTGWY